MTSPDYCTVTLTQEEFVALLNVKVLGTNGISKENRERFWGLVTKACKAPVIPDLPKVDHSAQVGQSGLPWYLGSWPRILGDKIMAGVDVASGDDSTTLMAFMAHPKEVRIGDRIDGGVRPVLEIHHNPISKSNTFSFRIDVGLWVYRRADQLVYIQRPVNVHKPRKLSLRAIEMRPGDIFVRGDLGTRFVVTSVSSYPYNTTQVNARLEDGEMVGSLFYPQDKLFEVERP